MRLTGIVENFLSFIVEMLDHRLGQRALQVNPESNLRFFLFLLRNFQTERDWAIRICFRKLFNNSSVLFRDKDRCNVHVHSMAIINHNNFRSFVDVISLSIAHNEMSLWKIKSVWGGAYNNNNLGADFLSIEYFIDKWTFSTSFNHEEWNSRWVFVSWSSREFCLITSINWLCYLHFSNNSWSILDTSKVCKFAFNNIQIIFRCFWIQFFIEFCDFIGQF